jgi:hypothetical protein
MRALVQQHIDQLNEKFARVEQVKKFEILPADLSQEGGELTPTMKVKRNVVADKYAGDRNSTASGRLAQASLSPDSFKGPHRNRSLTRSGGRPAPGATVLPGAGGGKAEALRGGGKRAALAHDLRCPIEADAPRRWRNGVEAAAASGLGLVDGQTATETAKRRTVS